MKKINIFIKTEIQYFSYKLIATIGHFWPPKISGNYSAISCGKHGGMGSCKYNIKLINLLQKKLIFIFFNYYTNLWKYQIYLFRHYW